MSARRISGVPSPSASAEMARASEGHSCDRYSAWIVPVTASVYDSLRLPPSAGAGLSISGLVSAWKAADALAGSVPSGQFDCLAQSAAKASNACWKPALWLMDLSHVDSFGSIA